MALRVTLIQGGGSGLDQVPAVQAILGAAGVDIEYDEHLAGWASLEKGGIAVPEALLQSVRANKLALKTKLLPPPGKYTAEGRPIRSKEAGNFNVQLRKELGLFASVRPVKNLPGLPARFDGVDMLVIREITEVTGDDQTAVCNLGSVNLARHLTTGPDGPPDVDWERLRDTVRTGNG